MNRPLGLGYINGWAGRADSAGVAGYCAEIEVFLKRRGMQAAEVLVEQDADGLGLRTLIAALDPPDHRVAVVVVPSLGHVTARLEDLAARVTVWTLYPERRWSAATDAAPAPVTGPVQQQSHL